VIVGICVGLKSMEKPMTNCGMSFPLVNQGPSYFLLRLFIDIIVYIFVMKSLVLFM